jgi:hypothetical protein
MIYPQKIWFSEVGLEDVDTIAATVDGILSGNTEPVFKAG